MMQNSCKIIGLTGGIATGKSTVTNFLVENGFKVIDADKIAREVVEVNCPAYKNIVEEFGTKVLNEDFTIDRKKLGDIIFNDKEKREKLNSIVHPRVFYEMKNRISSYCADEQVVFLDIPLLIEGLNLFKKNDINIDEIWLVYTDEEIQIKRLMQRDKLSYEDAKKRIDSQLPMGTKMKYATRIINNNKDIKELKNTLENMIIRFK
ncbi:dephospho-CoA kinase [Anaerosalibacter massiliensis]|uniref:Dephospho-CoA kinase n=2 Tax=Anaerosalibacter massiliensis TaxID=1347392 RepID=A0A9X2MPY7_9FIRM|nr:dephospho-CoA kinase [Anaerosalibacter massiliensis]MCR2045021.1 dephospho-CoA kinase [Anaerosalibacter massiliensis]